VKASGCTLHGQHQIRLFDHLLAVKVEVGEVQQQRVLLSTVVGEVPDLVAGEPVGLGVHSQRLVVRNDHARGRLPPAGHLFVVDAKLAGTFALPRGCVGRRVQVLLRHQICIDIVIGNGTVLVRPGDSVDSESAGAVVVAERTPQPGRVHEQVQPSRLLEGGVVSSANIPDRSTGDICVDMDSGRSCRPITGALLPADGAPRERRTVES
jgi:hypothetical protein